MIKYDNNTIADWNFGDENIVKVYRNGAVVYYKLINSSGTPEYQVCYAVVDDISQYSETEFEDVYDKATEKWYKLNNLDQYEEYGVFGSGRTITTYDGKLTIDDGYEYQYSGDSWVNVGEVFEGTIWYDPPSVSGQNAIFEFDHYWGDGYKMVINTYLSGSFSNQASFLLNTNHSPIEFTYYQNGFYYDMHDPTSTSSPDVYTGDYSYRIMKNNTLNSYVNGQIMNTILTYGTVRVELESTGEAIVTGSTNTGSSKNWYNGLYNLQVKIASTTTTAHFSGLKVYNANNELVNDLKFIKNTGVTGSQEISMYDSVLDVTYNNTTEYTPSYHISSGSTPIYPVEYDSKSAPLDDLTFNSLTEANEYAYNNCVYDGLKATIDGENYYFDNGWVKESRLPQGYTEVEYVESTGQSTVNLGIQLMKNANDTFNVVLDNEMTYVSTSGEHQTFITCCAEIAPTYYGWYERFQGSTSNVVINGTVGTLTTGRTLVSGSTYHTTISGITASGMQQDYPLNLFSSLDSTKTPFRFCKGKLYNMQVTYNNVLVRDLVPCTNPNNVAGLYDLVNDVFYGSESGYDALVAGSTV